MNPLKSKVIVQQRPVTFEAMQWTGNNTDEVATWAEHGMVEVVQLFNPGNREGDTGRDGPFLKLRADRHVRVGEWIVKDGWDLRILSNDAFWSEFVEVQ